ncbi:hypothetical protein ACFX16_046614 [Malus domestica]
MPCYHIIKSLLVLDDNKLSRLFANIQWVGLAKMRSNIASNISVLRALGVPETSISYWVSHRPFLVSLESDKFKENVKKVTSMGVPPTSASFMKVLYVIIRVNEPEWAQKMELYKNWGWTEDDFLLRLAELGLGFEQKERRCETILGRSCDVVSCLMIEVQQ